MELEHINEGNVRITITKEDLADRGMNLIDFMSDQRAVEDFFYTILDEAGIADEFEDSNVLSFQVVPSENSLEVYVSRDDVALEDTVDRILKGINGKKSHEAGDHLEAEEEKEEIKEFIYFSLEFDDFENVITLAQDLFINADATELYQYNGKYYLIILLNQIEIGSANVQNILGRVIEYGEKTAITRDVLVEYGQTVLQYDALEAIRKNFKD
ncbi:MAG: adaptor protein MecA [Streptococcaceae bacterium]|jgi:adapter protein MecA 1/2|nr:adaptor protein MecA [Streptococcaceae bacterium]